MASAQLHTCEMPSRAVPSLWFLFLCPDMLIPTILVIMISIHGLLKYWIETEDHESSDVTILILRHMLVQEPYSIIVNWSKSKVDWCSLSRMRWLYRSLSSSSSSALYCSHRWSRKNFEHPWSNSFTVGWLPNLDWLTKVTPWSRSTRNSTHLDDELLKNSGEYELRTVDSDWYIVLTDLTNLLLL